MLLCTYFPLGTCRYSNTSESLSTSTAIRSDSVGEISVFITRAVEFTPIIIRITLTGGKLKTTEYTK